MAPAPSLRLHGLAAIAVLLAGCATAPEPVSPAIGRIPTGEAQAIVRRWEREWEAFQGLRAAVELRVVKSGRAQRSAGVLLLSPTHLRFEIVAPLGLPTLVMSAGPERVMVWNPAEVKAWTSPATPEAMSRWMGVPVRPAMLIRLLGGHAPFPPGDGIMRLVQDGVPHLAFELGAVRQRVWVTPQGRPARVQIENGERLAAAFEWAVNGQLQGLALDVPKRSFKAHLRFISADYVAPPPEAFEIVIPAGVPIQSVD